MNETSSWLGDVLTTLGVIMLVAGLLFWLFLQRVNRELAGRVEQLREEIQSKILVLDVELDNGMYFCYNNSDRSFVCQGRTALEIREAFQQRFPDRVAYLNNDSEVPELKEELSRLRQNEASHSQ